MWDTIYQTAKVVYPDNDRICRNIVSFLHCIFLTQLVQHFRNEYNLISIVSGTYFIWDIFYMFQHKIEIVFLYHHLVALYTFMFPPDENLVLQYFLEAELSNVPNYIVYHKMKMNQNCQFEKFIQIIFQLYFRVYRFTRYIFMYYENTFVYNNLLAVYFLGLFWFFLLIKNFRRSITIINHHDKSD